MEKTPFRWVTSKLVSGAEIENLPSFGLNVSSGGDAKDMLMKIRDLAKAEEDVSGMRPNASGGRLPGASLLPQPAAVSTHLNNTSSQEVHIYVGEDSNIQRIEQGPDEYGFKFAAGISPVGTTVDTSQIMEVQPAPSGPILHVKINTHYMRFRYLSEKNLGSKKTGKKLRSYDDDSDKHCLAEVMVDNYTGTGKIVAYCVDCTGKLHPFNLFGDSCHHGVYVCRFKFRPGKVAKLQKVSITTPKAKEYEKIQTAQLAYLHEAGIQQLHKCNAETIADKQVVYVMVKVILDDGPILSQISTPITNKKKGKEFRIEDIEPVSALATGYVNSNILRNRVMLHVTEDTAFPSEVGVKIRQINAKRQIIWEVEPAEVVVVKQCVVKFVPPPFKNPKIEEDVEVEICLYDKATRQETEPFKFVYIGSDNCPHDLQRKAKKRKLDEDLLTSATFDPDEVVQGQRKVLSRLNPASASGSSSPENIHESKPAGFYRTDPINQTQANPTEAIKTESDRDVSLRGQGTTNNQLPFSSYVVEGQGQTARQGPKHSIFGAGSSQTVLHPPRPQSAGVSGVSEREGPGLYQTPVVTSTSVFGTAQQTATYQSAQSTSHTVSVHSNTSTPHHQQEEANIITDEDQLLLAQQGAQLPKLGPNQMFALIGGQIFIVNDDENTESSDPRQGGSSEAATNSPPSMVQNIGQQQVLITPMPPQHPTTEMGRATGQMPTATRGSGASNLDQGAGPAAGNITDFMCTSEDLLATLTVAAQQHEQQQQQYLQQELQQQQQALLLAQQIAAVSGIDLSHPDAVQQLLHQVLALQNQQQSEIANSGNVIAQGSNLNDDDDIETDGGSSTGEKNMSNNANGQMSHKEQRNKKLRPEAEIVTDGLIQNVKTEIVAPEEVDAASRIPIFVNEVTVDDDSVEMVSSEDEGKTGKSIAYSFKNGSFGNGDTSDEDDS